MLKGFSAFPDVDIVGARYLLAQDSLENIVERPQRSNATPRLVPAREIIEDTVLHMGAYMARPGFQMQLDDRLTISDVWLVREWALSDARICFLEDIVSVYRQHGQQTTMATNTLRTLSDLMTTDVWVVAQRPEYYASTLAPRMDHCWWLRNQRKDLPHLVALLDILRSLIRARYVLATANWRAVGLVINAVWTDLNETGRRLTTVVDSLTQRLASATGIPAPAEGAHATSFTFAEDAPGRPANIPPLDAKTMPAVREMVQLIYRAGLQVEQLIPLAELADTLVS